VASLLCAFEEGLLAPLRQFGASMALGVQNDARNVKKVRAALDAALAEAGGQGCGVGGDGGNGATINGGGGREGEGGGTGGEGRMSVRQLLAYEVSRGMHTLAPSTDSTPSKGAPTPHPHSPARAAPPSAGQANSRQSSDLPATSPPNSPSRGWLSSPRTPSTSGAILADPSAAIGLTWLSRSLHFTSLLMRGICEGGPPESAEAAANRSSRAVRQAYETALLRYHGWLMQPLFNGCAKRAPSYTELLRLFAPDVDDDSRQPLVLAEMESFAAAAAAVVDTIARTLAEAGLVDERKA
jgi:hypothetical protein